MRRDRVALFLAIGVPLLAFALLALTFSNAVIRDLRVGVVDADRSPTSMIYVQAVGLGAGRHRRRALRATSTARCMRYARAMRSRRSTSRRISSAISSPANARRSSSSTTGSSSRPATTPRARSPAPSTRRPRPCRQRRRRGAAAFAPGPLVVEQYVLTNPALNFAQFLLRAVLPTVLHVVTAIAAGYAVGSEFSTRSEGAWLRGGGRQSARGARRKARAAVWHFRADDGRRRGDHPRRRSRFRFAATPSSWARRRVCC